MQTTATGSALEQFEANVEAGIPSAVVIRPEAKTTYLQGEAFRVCAHCGKNRDQHDFENGGACPSIAVHHFSSTEDAYDACQCDEAIKTGDVLVIASEGVVGVAYTWPFAVTPEAGELHQLGPDASDVRAEFAESIKIAKAEAAKLAGTAAVASFQPRIDAMLRGADTPEQIAEALGEHSDYEIADHICHDWGFDLPKPTRAQAAAGVADFRARFLVEQAKLLPFTVFHINHGAITVDHVMAPSADAALEAAKAQDLCDPVIFGGHISALASE